MRDPNRIDPILARLRAAWIARPDLRLGQLLVGSLPMQPIYGYPSDDAWMADRLRRLFAAECAEFGAANAPIVWPAVDRPAPTPSLNLEAIGAKLRDALGYWTARASKSIVDGSKADDLNGDALTPWGHVARVALAIDRPAPTATPGLDLDAVEVAHAKMTAGEWYVHVLPTSPASGLLVFDVGPSDDHPVATTSGADTESIDEAEANAAGIVALKNAAPAMFAEVRAARAEVEALTAELAAARAVPADVEAAIGGVCPDHRNVPDCDCKIAAAYDTLRTAIARAIREAAAAAVGEFIDRHAKLLCEQAGHVWNRDDEEAEEWASDVHDVLNHLRADETGHVHDGRKRTTAPSASVGGLLATATPRCSCTHEAGDSRCDAHPTCSECGATTPRPVDSCDACRGPLPKGG